jgi:hypothetical protein
MDWSAHHVPPVRITIIKLPHALLAQLGTHARTCRLPRNRVRLVNMRTLVLALVSSVHKARILILRAQIVPHVQPGMRVRMPTTRLLTVPLGILHLQVP